MPGREKIYERIGFKPTKRKNKKGKRKGDFGGLFVLVFLVDLNQEEGRCPYLTKIHRFQWSNNRFLNFGSEIILGRSEWLKTP